MTLQYSVALRTNQVAQLQATIGIAGVLKLFSGAEPSDTTQPDPTGLLVTLALPSTFLTSAAGVASLFGTWSSTVTTGGDAASFRIYDTLGTCHLQGSVTATAGGGDLTLPSVTLVMAQPISISTFAITAANQ